MNRAAIIGAGPMGLAACLELAEQGLRPVLFEADDRVGGMSASFDFGGLELERFYHFHCTSDVDFLALLERLDLTHRFHWVETKMGYWYDGKVQGWGNPLALVKFRGLSWAAKIRYGAHAFSSVRRNRWRRLDQLQGSTWVRRWVGSEAWEVLWRRLFELKFYEMTDEVSAAWIWSRVRRIGRSRSSLMKEKLGYLEGGSKTWLDAVTNRIEAAGGEIRLASPVDEVVVDNGQLVGIRTGSKLLEFDAVISTAPLPLIPRLIPGLPEEQQKRYSQLRNVGAVCVVLKLKRPLTENFWLNTSDDEMMIPGLVEYSNLRPLDNAVVYVPFYMPTSNSKFSESDEWFIETCQRYLMRINSDLGPEDFLDFNVGRLQYAQPVCGPGFLDDLPPIQTGVDGLLVADTSHYYPEDRGISESLALGRRLAELAIGS